MKRIHRPYGRVITAIVVVIVVRAVWLGVAVSASNTVPPSSVGLVTVSAP